MYLFSITNRNKGKVPAFFKEKLKWFKASLGKKRKQVNQVRRKCFSVSNLEGINAQLQRGDRNQCYTSHDMTQNMMLLQDFSEDTWVCRNLIVYTDMFVDCAICENKMNKIIKVVNQKKKKKQSISSRVACDAALTHGFTVRVEVQVCSCGTTAESEAALWCLCTTLIKPSDLPGASELAAKLSGGGACGAGRIQPVQQPWRQRRRRRAGLQSQLQPQVCCCAAPPPPHSPRSPLWN